MSDQCALEGCERPAEVDFEECILHCSKDPSNLADDNEARMLKRFSKELVDYLLDKLVSHREPNFDNYAELITSELVRETRNSNVLSYLREARIHIEQIEFPKPWNVIPDYEMTLSKIGSINFIRCRFHRNSFAKTNAQRLFEWCIFFGDWDPLGPVPIDGNLSLYIKCEFKGIVSIEDVETKRIRLTHGLFSDCQFNGDVRIVNADCDTQLFRNSDHFETTVQILALIGCTFNDRFDFDDAKVKGFLVANCDFRSKFSFKRSCVRDEFVLLNSNFSGVFNCFEATFVKFVLNQCVVSEAAVLEKCRFGIESIDGMNAKFMYTTFRSFLNFQGASFLNGLDIENVNLKSPPNFLKADVAYEGSNRETFRIIKDSFDKVGNHIEANKYFAKEMRKYREEVAADGDFWTKLIVNMNYGISNFGQSYIRPICIFLIFAILYSVLVYGQESNWIYGWFEWTDWAFENASRPFNFFAKQIMPFSRFLQPGMEFVSLLFYIIFIALIYQTIVALKRHVRR